MSMNRKQRRLQEKKAGNKSNPRGGANIEKAAEARAQGLSLKNAGREAEAVPFLTEALRLDSSLADVHFALAMLAKLKPELGVDMSAVNQSLRDRIALKSAYHHILALLKKRKQYKETLLCQEELCRLFPDDKKEKAALALLLSVTDQKERGAILIAELMAEDPDDRKTKALFVNISSNLLMQSFHPAVKQAVQACFDNIYEANLSRMYPVWISQALRDPECSGLRTADKKINEEDLFAWLASAELKELDLFQNKFFLDGVRLLSLADPLLEIFLTRTRKWLCLNYKNESLQNRLPYFEHFVAALGQQCFFNEYVFSETQAEKENVDALIKGLKANQNVMPSRAFALALISSYRPLYRVFPASTPMMENIASQSDTFRQLIRTQYFEPLEEERLKSELNTFGELSNAISQNVQSQYEENPYPRWISVISFPSFTENPAYKESSPDKSLSILIAGCGTGRQAIDTAAAHPRAKLVAIDLSRTSLAYAQRKANEAGVANRIDFYHADILSMAEWEEQFDTIECSGVMHHMEDPFAGWKVLTDRLKPGGYFKVGLYSETARKEYVAGQNFAKEKGFPPTLEGIRAFREAVLALPTTDRMREIVSKSGDFYATSLVRDLIFHVQEHRMSLPQIKDMMDRLGLDCTGFIISDAVTMNRYDKMFPDDLDRSNMMNWHKYEQKYPLTFVGMYQFWCQKKV